MADFLRYDHLDALESPVAVLSRDGRVLYRNPAAICLSPEFRRGNRLADIFPDKEETLKKCIYRKKPAISPVRLRIDVSFTALLIPDFSPEGACVLLVLAPLLEGRFCYVPSAASRLPEPFVEDVATLPDGKVLSKLGEALLRSYGALFLPSPDEEAHTMSALCLFLNRLFERVFSFHTQEAAAKCTGECLGAPLRNFERLASALACLSALLAVNAADGHLEVFLCCRGGCACFDLLLRASRRMHPVSLPELLPGRKVELSVLDACFDRLGYDVSLSYNGSLLDIQLLGRAALPAGSFKAPAPEEERQEILKVEELLARFLA